MPGITLVGIIGMAIMYWVIKIVILRRNVIKKQIDGSLLINTMGLLKFGVFMFGLMNYYFLDSVFDRTLYFSYITLIISIFFLILPIRPFLINKFVTYEKVEQHEGLTYYDYYENFMHYDLYNPVTIYKGLGRLEGNDLPSQMRMCLSKVAQKYNASNKTCTDLIKKGSETGRYDKPLQHSETMKEKGNEYLDYSVFKSLKLQGLRILYGFVSPSFNNNVQSISQVDENKDSNHESDPESREKV